jgi:hypothetical protein
MLNTKLVMRWRLFAESGRIAFEVRYGNMLLYTGGVPIGEFAETYPQVWHRDIYPRQENEGETEVTLVPVDTLT